MANHRRGGILLRILLIGVLVSMSCKVMDNMTQPTALSPTAPDLPTAVPATVEGQTPAAATE